MATPPAPVDHAQVREFWDRAIAVGALEPGTPLPAVVEPFGDHRELADELVTLVVDGPKRATAGAVADYELSGDPVPSVGMVSIATDGSGRARAVLRTTDVRIGPMSSVDEPFAWDEGEGDRTRAGWLRDHEGFFRRYLPAIGLTFDPDMLLVFERFDVLYSE